jgi:hypothetical protein
MSAEEAIKKSYVQGYFAGIDDRYTNNTAYTDGFKAGQRNEREYILGFIDDHEGIPITAQDIANEIEGRYKREQNEILKGLGL